LYVADAEGRFVDGNPTLLELFGARAPEQLTERSPNELWGDPARRAEELQLLRRGGAVGGFELTVHGADGRSRVVRDACALVEETDAPTAVVAGVLVDITDVREREEQLQRLAVRDPLTGCYNRRHLQALQDALDSERDAWSAIVTDIDAFKQYNDRHGHRRGDEVLIQFGRFLMQQVRAADAVVRLGGDEFLVLLVGDDAPFTEVVLTRLRDAAGASAPISFSMGWAIGQPRETLQSTIDRADKHLIRVKVVERREPKKRRRSADYPSPDAG
jgi:diguanylate cyclase (GGDEF)-like protein/PAS domain S-box-containing protein